MPCHSAGDRVEVGGPAAAGFELVRRTVEGRVAGGAFLYGKGKEGLVGVCFFFLYLLSFLGLGWGLDCFGLDWIGLDWVELNWIGLYDIVVQRYRMKE